MINIKKSKALRINQKYAIVANEENLTTSQLAKKYDGRLHEHRQRSQQSRSLKR